MNLRKGLIKTLLATISLTILVVTIQIGMQFIQSYKFVGFEKRDQSTWVGIAEVAQADYQNCQADLNTLKKARDEANSDIMK